MLLEIFQPVSFFLGALKYAIHWYEIGNFAYIILNNGFLHLWIHHEEQDRDQRVHTLKLPRYFVAAAICPSWQLASALLSTPVYWPTWH